MFGNRFLVGPPPAQCFPLFSTRYWTWQLGDFLQVQIAFLCDLVVLEGFALLFGQWLCASALSAQVFSSPQPSSVVKTWVLCLVCWHVFWSRSQPPPTSYPLITIGGGSGSGPGGIMTRQGHQQKSDTCYNVFSTSQFEMLSRT